MYNIGIIYLFLLFVYLAHRICKFDRVKPLMCFPFLQLLVLCYPNFTEFHLWSSNYIEESRWYISSSPKEVVCCLQEGIGFWEAPEEKSKAKQNRMDVNLSKNLSLFRVLLSLAQVLILSYWVLWFYICCFLYLAGLQHSSKMSCEKTLCTEPCSVPCDVKCPEPRATACNEPCVITCPDSRVIIFPPPVVVTFPGPILTTYPQETIVGSTESAELAGSLESAVGIASAQKGAECIEPCIDRCAPQLATKCEPQCVPQCAAQCAPPCAPQCVPECSYTYSTHWKHPCQRGFCKKI